MSVSLIPARVVARICRSESVNVICPRVRFRIKPQVSRNYWFSGAVCEITSLRGIDPYFCQNSYSNCGGVISDKKIMSSLPPEVKAKLDKVADVRIDPSGKYKYILIKVYAVDGSGKHVDENSKVVVRGRADCPYHGDIFDKFQEETSNLEGLDDDILGGGRILREGNKILVFGYSQGYGQADHALTVEILKKEFPTHQITWNNEGY